MGASIKRKGLRRIKFGSRDDEVPKVIAGKEELKEDKSNLEAEDDELPAPARKQSNPAAIPVATQGTAQRFIVFIGNLPFEATDEALQLHFRKVQPVAIRHRKHRETGRSKGFAFVEFDRYDRMKTCLSLYHHTTFLIDGVASRKMNVELTAGGGGSKSRDRAQKLQQKNNRLNEQRKRKAENSTIDVAVTHDDMNPSMSMEEGAIHPSRRKQMRSTTSSG